MGIVGLLAYLVVGVFPYLASGLMVPGPWLYILWAIWLVGAVLAWRTFQRRPVMVLLFAPAAVAFWFLYRDGSASNCWAGPPRSIDPLRRTDRD